MNGYMIHHEIAINRQAAAIKALAGDYLQVIADAEAITKMPGWDSPAADTQRAEIQKILNEARDTVSALQKIGNDLYAFTASHKTWLEDIIDAVT